MKEVFKAGESVYRFSVISGVTIEVLEDIGDESEIYPLQCDGDSYTEYGGLHNTAEIPSLYKLTEENYKKLCGFVGEDAVPPLPRGSDLTEQLLENQIYVIGKGSNVSDDDARSNDCFEVIKKSLSDSYAFEGTVYLYKFVVAYDVNGNEITEIPEPIDENIHSEKH